MQINKNRDSFFFWLIFAPVILCLFIGALFLAACIPAFIMSFVFDISYITALIICGGIIAVWFAVKISQTQIDSQAANAEEQLPKNQDSPSFATGVITGYWLHRLLSRS